MSVIILRNIQRQNRVGL